MKANLLHSSETSDRAVRERPGGVGAVAGAGVAGVLGRPTCVFIRNEGGIIAVENFLAAGKFG